MVGYSLMLRFFIYSIASGDSLNITSGSPLNFLICNNTRVTYGRRTIHIYIYISTNDNQNNQWQNTTRKRYGVRNTVELRWSGPPIIR